MTDSVIISTIKNLQKEYSGYKDGGRAFVEALAKKINNTVDEEKKEVIDFLLREIELNANDLGDLALRTIEFLDSPDMANRLEEIYKRQHNKKDEYWKQGVLLKLLMKSHPSAIYDDYLEKSPEAKEYFYFLSYYSKLYPQKGIPLLADSLIEDHHVAATLPSDNPNSFAGVEFDMLTLIMVSEELVTPLLEEVRRKNAKAAEHLKKHLVHLLEHYPYRFSKEIKDSFLAEL